MFKSIKSSLALTIVGAVVTTSVMVLWLAMLEHEKLYTQAVSKDLAVTTRNFSRDLTSLMAMMEPQPAQLQDALEGLQNFDNLVYVRVYDAQRQPLTSLLGKVSERTGVMDTEPDWLSVVDRDIGVSIENSQLVSFERIGSPTFPLGYLLVVNDIAGPVERSRRSLWWQTLPLVTVGLLITILACLYLLNRLMQPLYSLSSFTRLVRESKDYSLRFSEPNDYEVSRLGEDINSLMDAIEVELNINQEQNHTLLEQQETMTRLANYDSLTGLPNRQFVMDNLRLELARCRRGQQDLVLLFFDLDGFKGINDSLGHETGDLILIEVADRVTSLLTEGDLVARLGGDEFIVLPEGDCSETSITNLANRIITAFNESFQLRGLALTVGVSIGIARASDAGYELSQLMSNADLAMYRSKAKGRGTFTIFTPDMVESYKRKLQLANSMDQAILNNEFVVYYQPKVAASGDIIGFEALIRWQHPEFGLVMPGEFIPIAEQGGKISAITRWVIGQVCQELPTLRERMQGRFRVSINLSGHDLRDSNLFDMIHQMFGRYNVAPEFIEFEVTESAYLENFELSNKFFRRVANMGCAIALDDFGTGYSSLSYLTQIRIDTLKIDRQFILKLETSERSRLVTGTIIDLAKRLKLTVCAEGIENHNQWEYLLEHGVDHVQGYLFSKPVPLEAAIQLPLNFKRGPVDSLAKESVG